MNKVDQSFFVSSLENANARIKWFTACAERDFARDGDWSRDWNVPVSEAIADAEEAISKLGDTSSAHAMPNFRKKPVKIHAFQWRGQTFRDAREFSAENGLPQWKLGSRGKKSGLIIPTLERGDHVAEFGDWIIRGVHGEYYPCKPDIFEKTYEPVE